ncbi:MAG: EF-P beta-lysylation protein EpmB [Methylovulum sp.]|nr:EF-P beta-lysylation protein EpmB [Methylovulum sp.]
MPVPFPDSPHFLKNWQQQLAEAFTDFADLCRYLNLTVADLPVSQAAARDFPMRVPLNFASCIEKGNPDDPLLRQILPVSHELQSYPGFTNDPVGDLAATAQTGLLHKYHGRVLLINTGSCAINCRYCFRRNFPYGDLQLGKQAEQAAITYIQQDPGISEVILSGGDPLLLSDARLAQLFDKLIAVKHVKRIRIHSRLPIVLPARITAEFIETLKQSGKQIIIVMHCNHANELNGHVLAACHSLRNQPFTLLNQSVLLKGVNDNGCVLCELSERLFEAGVLPYYLHLLDKAKGTGHFEVPEAVALDLHRQMQAKLPGYLVPKLVREIAGGRSKSYVT